MNQKSSKILPYPRYENLTEPCYNAMFHGPIQVTQWHLHRLAPLWPTHWCPALSFLVSWIGWLDFSWNFIMKMIWNADSPHWVKLTQPLKIIKWLLQQLLSVWEAPAKKKKNMFKYWILCLRCTKWHTAAAQQKVGHISSSSDCTTLKANASTAPHHQARTIPLLQTLYGSSSLKSRPNASC